MDPLSDEKIIESWLTNADPWTNAVRDRKIESRKLVTDAAIVNAVMSRRPRSVLDIGCGEGWLARELSSRGVTVTGVDVVPELIESARKAGGGTFEIASYEDIAAGKLAMRVDVAVANFSLIGKDSVDSLVDCIPQLLAAGGAFIVQTLHPRTANGDLPYADGWRKGSWAGFSAEFTDPAPWYFRTLESWRELLERTGLTVAISEPINPVTGEPASVILIGS